MQQIPPVPFTWGFTANLGCVTHVVQIVEEKGTLFFSEALSQTASKPQPSSSSVKPIGNRAEWRRNLAEEGKNGLASSELPFQQTSLPSSAKPTSSRGKAGRGNEVSPLFEQLPKRKELPLPASAASAAKTGGECALLLRKPQHLG